MTAWSRFPRRAGLSEKRAEDRKERTAVNKFLANFLCFCGACFVFVSVLELGFRVTGVSPRTSPEVDRPITSYFIRDEELGWRNRPVHVTSWRVSSDRKTVYRILPDGSRQTSDSPRPGPTVLLLGGSFVNGATTLSDEEGVAWKLQALLPEDNVKNFGTLAYGTYQSYLLLRRLIETGTPPRFIVYGFFPFHIERNVAALNWLYSMSVLSRETVEIPYVTLSESGRLAPKTHWARYRTLPGATLLSSVAWLELRLAAIEERSRVERANEKTLAVIHEMKSLAERHGAQFAVSVLSSGDPREEKVKAAFPNNLIDCPIADNWLDDERFLVEEDRHPSGDIHTAWATCVANFISAQSQSRQ